MQKIIEKKHNRVKSKFNKIKLEYLRIFYFMII